MYLCTHYASSSTLCEFDCVCVFREPNVERKLWVCFTVAQLPRAEHTHTHTIPHPFGLKALTLQTRIKKLLLFHPLSAQMCSPWFFFSPQLFTFVLFYWNVLYFQQIFKYIFIDSTLTLHLHSFLHFYFTHDQREVSCFPSNAYKLSILSTLLTGLINSAETTRQFVLDWKKLFRF